MSVQKSVRMAGRTCAQTSDRKGACVGVGAGEPTSVGTGIGMSSQVADAACVGLGVAVRVNAGEVAGEGVCEVVGNVAGDAAGDAVRDGMGVPQAVPRGEHGGELAADAEQAVERRVFRYARHLERSRLTAAERVLAVSRYQDGIGRLVAFESAFRLRVQAMPGVGMGEWQSALYLGRRLYARFRRTPAELRTCRLAEACRDWDDSRLSREKVLLVLRCAWQVLEPDADEAALCELASVAQEKFDEPKGNGGSMPESEVVSQVEPKPAKPASRRRQESGVAGMSPEALEQALSEPSDLARVQSQNATAKLREALGLLKPWARQCVVGRLVWHRSSERLARELGMSEDQVEDVLKRARTVIRKFTNYFDEDFFWQARRRAKAQTN